MLRRHGYRVLGPDARGVGGPLPSLPDPLAGVGDSIRAAGGTIVAGGMVALGATLVVFGLLLATGLAGRGGRSAVQVGQLVAALGL